MRSFNPFEHLGLMRDILGLIVAAVTAIWAWIKLRKAPSWPTAQATVMSTYSGRRDSGGWGCFLTYSYAVNGDYYSGVWAIKTRNEKLADELASQWKGRSIVVRYSPTNHEVSALLKDDQIGGFGN